MRSGSTVHAPPGRSPQRRRTIAALVTAGVVASLLTGATVAAPAAAADVPLSQGKPALASSTENGGVAAAAAVDGDPQTRWSSVHSDPQWIRVDLGGTANVTKVELQWEVAYARAFQFQTSPDGNAWTTVYSTTTGAGGNQTLAVNGTGRYVRLNGTARGTEYGYSLFEFKVFGSYTTPPSQSGYVLADPPVTGVVPSTATPPFSYHREFQANCSTTRDLPDDPIVFPNLPGASHMHTFMGNTTTNAASTLQSLRAGGTSCVTPGDKSGYWMPTMYNGDQVVNPIGAQVIYYKSGVIDYTSVRPFPLGLRYVVGSPTASAAEFMAASVEGWECGDSARNADFPTNCPVDSQLNVRYQAPSCWDGKYLDTPDHKSHLAYPVNGICSTSHPVAVPMIEFKMAFPASGDTSRVRLSSGRGYSFHYDFYNAWDPATLAALLRQCINGGLQCNPRGYDQYHPEIPPVLNERYELP